jgi:Fur family transcriptional regulator, ferric uptake regulator
MTSKAKPEPAGGKRLDWQHAESLAETQLRETAVRATAARVRVLASLLGARRAFSHQDLQDSLVDMDRVTLYRALDCLTEAGLAHKIAGDDRIFRYSAGAEHAGSAEHGTQHATARNGGQHQHGHFKCTRCAQVFCLDDSTQAGLLAGNAVSSTAPASMRSQLQSILRQSLGPGFKSHDIELTIKGFCSNCAR